MSWRARLGLYGLVVARWTGKIHPARQPAAGRVLSGTWKYCWCPRDLRCASLPSLAAAFVFCYVHLLLLPCLSYKRIGAFAALFFAGIPLLFQDSNWFSAECFHLCRSLFFFFFLFWRYFSVKIALLRLSSRTLLRLKSERIYLARVSALNAIRRYTWGRRQRSSFFFFCLIFRSAALPLLMLLGVFRSA